MPLRVARPANLLGFPARSCDRCCGGYRGSYHFDRSRYIYGPLWRELSHEFVASRRLSVYDLHSSLLEVHRAVLSDGPLVDASGPPRACAVFGARGVTEQIGDAIFIITHTVCVKAVP